MKKKIKENKMEGYTIITIKLEFRLEQKMRNIQIEICK